MVVAGIAVSKALVDVSVAGGPVYRFANSDPGLRGRTPRPAPKPAPTGPSETQHRLPAARKYP